MEVRVIDFDNTSCYVENGDSIPDGTNISVPDDGYLLGLANLKSMLLDLRKELEGRNSLTGSDEQTTITTLTEPSVEHLRFM